MEPIPHLDHTSKKLYCIVVISFDLNSKIAPKADLNAKLGLTFNICSTLRLNGYYDQQDIWVVTCSPFPLWPPLAGLLRLGFLCLFPSFFLIVASSIFILFLSKVIVFIIAAKVICREDTEGIQGAGNPLFSLIKWLDQQSPLNWKIDELTC